MNMRRITVRRSQVHGKGVFALRRFAAGERVLEYKGELTTWDEAGRRHQRDGVEGHTFFFGLSDGCVLDGSYGGHRARWVNHACAANCEAVEEAGGGVIRKHLDTGGGAEKFFVFQLEVVEPPFL